MLRGLRKGGVKMEPNAEKKIDAVQHQLDKFYDVVSVKMTEKVDGNSFSTALVYLIPFSGSFAGDDPGINNQKTPTILLLSPNQHFHSFGFTRCSAI